MKLNKQTLSEQIYQILRKDILLQNIPGGTKLTLKSLIERFGVSSTPIREALTRLSEEQLVSYYSNVGVSVVELSDEDMCEIYEFMGDLDALAVSYSSDSGRTEELISELSGNISSAEKTLQIISASQDGSDEKNTLHDAEENIRQFITLSDEFHLLFYKYCNNSRLRRSADRMRSQMSIAAYSYQKNTANLVPIHMEHKQIYKAFSSGDYTEACRLMRLHMKHSLNFALQKKPDCI